MSGGCGRPSEAPRRLSIATGGTGGVYYPLGGAIARIISRDLPGVEATAEVTSASVDNLKFLKSGKADLAFSLADTLADAAGGKGAFAGSEPAPVRALAVLYDNYTHVVARADRGLARVADLRGHVVSVGAPGSGTEVVALRILEAAGVDPAAGIRREALGVAPSADALKDGKIDAFFWSGGLPTASILDLAHGGSPRVVLLPTDEVLPVLAQRHGESHYRRGLIPQSAYPGMTADVAVIVISNVLVVHESMPVDLAYGITRLLFERKAELEAVHAEARNLRLETATGSCPVPFHAGASRYYREQKAAP